MRRIQVDRGTLRSAGFVTLLTVVFLVTNTAVAAAADGSAPGGGLLSPLDIPTREGVPLSSYQLESNVEAPSTGEVVGSVVTGTRPFDIAGETQRLLIGGLFTLVRLLVGLCCWLLRFVFDFPLLTLFTDPAQNLADAYQRNVVDVLGLHGLLLAWAFVFGLIAFVRGKVGQGLGEIALTLVIAALAASAFVRPDYLLGQDGPLAQTHRAAIEVASISTSSYFDSPGRGGRPCDSAVGPAHEACVNEQVQGQAVATPIQNALTDALVVRPYMLLQYGRVLDPKVPDEAAAYKAHLKWVQGNAPQADAAKDGQDACELLDSDSKKTCESRQKKLENCELLDPQSAKRCRELVTSDEGFPALIKELNGAGPVGKSAALYAQKPSWDRVWGVLALLVAVIVVALMIVSMSVVMLGAQGADAAAAAGGPIAWVWAMLPGPSRMLLWRWLGVFIVSALVAFVAAMVLPMFGIAVDALLADAGPGQMMERLLLLDALAVAFLILHRRVLAATSGFGQRMATRMRFAKIGGSHLRGDNSEFGASLAMHGPSATPGIGALGGGSAVHGAFGARLRSLGGIAALDGPGMQFSPSRLLGDAMAEGRRGIAPLALALRGAHAALIGPKPGQHPAAAQLHAHAGTGGQGPNGGAVVVDKETGQVLHDPATDRPLLGGRIHARASRLRGYRIASRTARIAYGATLGLPRTLHRARSTGSEFTQDVRQQLGVTANHAREDGYAWAQGGRAVRDRVDHTGQVLATKWQVHDPAGKVRDTAIAATIATAPLADAARPMARTSVSRPLSGSTPTTPGAGGTSGRRAKASRDGNTAPGRAAAPDGGTTTAGGRTAGSGMAAPASRRRPQPQPWPQPRPRPQAQRPAPGGARSEDEARAAEEANRERLRRMFERRVAEAERRRRESGGES
ncbi:hypothetical protein [Streptomyces sp. NPDC048269]|uniref:hypothetical protein n=1 Tax=Streptomyces sp. NPDC048269 TaxID=3155753 RepID=UPI0034435AAF